MINYTLDKEIKKIALVSCSDPFPNNKIDLITDLIKTLNSLGVNVISSKYLFSDHNGSFYDYEAKGSELNGFFKDDKIDAIFDISGGDLANTILDYIDFNLIAHYRKIFCGYSDLTSILNPLYKYSNSPVICYQIRNLILADKERQISNFRDFLSASNQNLFQFHYEFLSGSDFTGTVVGGNIRCLLKLAGTKYMVDFNHKILFLESLSGKENKIRSFFSQLKQIGAFDNLRGVVLGTFTELQTIHSKAYTDKLFKTLIPSGIPIVKTEELGHNSNSKAMILGATYQFIK